MVVPSRHFPIAPLYFVTDEHRTNGRSLFTVVQKAIEGGVRWIQLRIKTGSDQSFIEQCRPMVSLCKAAGVTTIINDRVDTVVALGADGVHLGQEDADIQQTREKLGPNGIIGLSTHNEQEVIDAQKLPIDYINIGPMFPTQTKAHLTYPPLGLQQVAQLAHLSHLPVTTMGGIKQHHLPSILKAGLQTVAMVTEISEAEQIEARVQEILQTIESTRVTNQNDNK